MTIKPNNKDAMLPWDEQLAFELAYQVHRVIGNNINAYRKHTARDMLKLIRKASERNKKP